eukprot:scaffold4.g5020.t1
MDEEYDAIILGTGLKECIVSGLLSVDGLKLYERFRPGQKPPAELGPSRDYNVDLVPKFIMANGNLVKILIHTDVTKYLEFKSVDGSYVLSKGRVEKAPATDWEALRSPLMGLFEKRRAAKFFSYCQQYNETDPGTWQGRDLSRITMQAFARLSAVYGGTYMLSKPDVEVVYDAEGRAVGVRSEGETARARLVVGDPSYFPDRIMRVGQVVRAMCVLSHPIPSTSDSHSVQIILPQKQAGASRAGGGGLPVGRRSDIYVFCCSYSHNVAPRDKWVAFVSTTVETTDPQAELAPGLQLLGKIDEKFVEARRGDAAWPLLWRGGLPWGRQGGGARVLLAAAPSREAL